MLRTSILVAGLCIAGCVSSPPVELESFPTALSLRTPDKYLKLYRNAKEDFQRLASIPKKRPLHVGTGSLFYDGGSAFYEGQGYRLKSWHRIVNKDGKFGFWTGPEIIFESPISQIGPISYSEARFEPR
jgi:hypothetical protein